MLNPQLDRRGELIHLLTTEGLPRRHVERLLDAARGLAAGAAPACRSSAVPVFLCLPDEAAKDRDAFAAAAQRLSLSAVTLEPQAGDALAETVARLAPGLLVLRHGASGAAHCAAAHAAPGLRILNAGDGCHADPLPALALVQAMLDARQDLTNLAVTLVGDIRHSRVARSIIHAMTTLGVPEVRAAAPRTLLPDGLPQLGVRACASLREGLQDADVVIVLPLRVEGISGALLPSAREYAHAYGLTPDALAAARSDALLLPAGVLTPGIETDGDVSASLTPIEAQLADIERHLRLAALDLLTGDAP
ncbi:aspartate carbamoyltransferase 1 [Achromobacter xylosoxidans A8]|uniref:Aspartate carbamoyltransferase 1 n=1 Tax=Achromobacter xylosoxidans (strain A8) TaxID=762376 RepID=E3HWQ5_ACHXA|nr:aspartate carbamoyltransferase [Achromobacter xylosoxidans]ADP13964.1 aspartate carbamoyltransferase 1 [Achromobacter xylosoxidans A8]